MWLVFVVWILEVLTAVHSANILILHPLYSGSHTIVLRQFGDYLVSRGHNVTQVKFRQSNSNSDPDTQVKVIDLPILDRDGSCGDFIKGGEFNLGVGAADVFWSKGTSMGMIPPNVFCVPRSHCNTLFSSRTFDHLMNSTDFDVALVDLFTNACGVAYMRSLGIPIAGFWGWSFQTTDVEHSPVLNLPSFVPATLSGLGPVMSFKERVMNFALVAVQRLLLGVYEATTQEKISQRFPELPPLPQLLHDIDLHLANANFVTDSAKLMTPNTVPIGGPQLRDGKPLPPVSFQ